MARYMICCGGCGSACCAFSSISSVSSSWSRLPQLTPMRTGLSWRHATSIIRAKLSSCLLPAPAPEPTLPGLMRNFDSACAQSGNCVNSLWPL